MRYLDQVSILDALLAEEKRQVANALVERLGAATLHGHSRAKLSAPKDAFCD